MTVQTVKRGEHTATVSYPCVGGSRHLCVVWNKQFSDVPFNADLYLNSAEIGHTVLAAAYFPDRDVYLPTPVPEPYDRILLPPVPRSLLREQLVRDSRGRRVGLALEVPGLLVKANQIVDFHQRDAEYRYGDAIAAMAREAVYLLAQVLKRAVVKVRHRPGFMGHAVARADLGLNQLVIPHAFAHRILHSQRELIPGVIRRPYDLDGFPIFAIRFPIANRHGMQAMVLRVVPGEGAFCAVNPFNLVRLYLGDQDGDQFFVLLRCREWEDGDVAVSRLKRLGSQSDPGVPHAVASLQRLLVPEELPISPRLKKKLAWPDLTTPEARVAAIQAADTRTHIATYTAMLGWVVPRILMTATPLGPQQASEVGADLLEVFMEGCMNERKLDGEFKEAGFNSLDFLETIQNGGPFPREQIELLALAPDLVQAFETAWTIAGGQLREYTSRQPVFDAVILQRKQMDRSLGELLDELRARGVADAQIYQTIVDDLTGISPVLESEEAAPCD